MQPSSGSSVSGFGNYWFQAFQDYLEQPCTILGDLDWKTTKDYLDEIPSDLERVDFLRRIEQLPDEGIVDSRIANPPAHNRNTYGLIHPLREECARLLSRHFDLGSVLRDARQIADHQEALSYLWDVLRDYKKYYPGTRRNEFLSGQLAFCNGVEEEIQYRKDLQVSSLATKNTSITAIREIKIGDTYQTGQAGAIGPNAHAHDMELSQTWNYLEGSIDLAQLAEELSKLRQEMKKEAVEVEQDIAVVEIGKAEQAARVGDGSRMLQHLKSAGKSALDVGTKIGTTLAVEVIKDSMGLNKK